MKKKLNFTLKISGHLPGKNKNYTKVTFKIK